MYAVNKQVSVTPKLASESII